MARCRQELLSAPPVLSQFGGGDTAALLCSRAATHPPNPNQLEFSTSLLKGFFDWPGTHFPHRDGFAEEI